MADQRDVRDTARVHERPRLGVGARPVTDDDLASYLMYPRVWTDYASDRLQYGDVGILPTPVFFYGMEPGQEMSVDIERGKTLIVRYITASEAHEDGTRTVFFELNGLPRSVRVQDRSQVAKRAPQRKVEAGNSKHVGAPMPGTIATVAAVVGRKVARGDVLAELGHVNVLGTIDGVDRTKADRYEHYSRDGCKREPHGITILQNNQ